LSFVGIIPPYFAVINSDTGVYREQLVFQLFRVNDG